MAPSTNSVYQPDRISKISRIMPQFTKVAAVGDTVMMGLEGDPAFPTAWKNGTRPMATITDVVSEVDGTSVKLRMDDGTQKVVNEYSIAPGDVWEYTDEAFSNVMERERKAQEIAMSRAETPVADASYRGDKSIVDDLRQEVELLKAQLSEERALTRSFQNTYIMTMKELANDVMKLDTSGSASFCRTFAHEYDKMQARAEQSIYRGSTNNATDVHTTEMKAEQDDDEDEFSEESDDEETSRQMAMSDYF